tara:strand:+ start:209 stop:796 length:588 start_codon:yes stop_codon:yes gene_type:complete
MKNLLVEYNVINYGKELLAEAADITRPLVLKNVLLQRAEKKNQNGRIYPQEILMREAGLYKDNFVSQRRALGELDHPESPVVNLKNVCCNVTDLWFEGDNVKGNIEILSTPSGNIVRELIKNNIRLGVSSRGMGSVRQMGEGTVEVQDDFSLVCFDIVSNPSTHGAFINENQGSQIVTPYSRIDSLIYDFLSEVK